MEQGRENTDLLCKLYIALFENTYKEEKLDEDATSEYFSVVQKEGNRGVSCNTGMSEFDGQTERYFKGDYNC